MTLLAGRYRLRGTIARGGMAVVHRADDTVLRRSVAVKALAPERASNVALRAAVRREALMTAALSHPNIVRVLDYGESGRPGGRLPFLVLELLSGESLSARLSKHGPLRWPEAARICAGVGAALAAVHAHDLVHQDIKPGNIMVSSSGVKVIDLGLAAGSGRRSTDPAGLVWGTPGYLAPEQLCGEPTSPAADVFALGLVFRACLTGRRAWPGTTVDEVLIARACTPAPELPKSTDVPEPLVRLYRACLNRSPDQRPSARHIVRALDTAVTGKLVEAGRTRKWGLLPIGHRGG